MQRKASRRRKRKRIQHKYNILLDENVFRREKIPLVNSYHRVSHILHDLGKSGLSDEKILAIAKKRKAIIVTTNAKDFVDKAIEEKIDVFGITNALAAEPGTLDTKLAAHLRRRKSKRMTGKLRKFTK